MKRYTETSCNGMVEAADGPWVSYDDTSGRTKKTNEINDLFINAAIECLNALSDTWGSGILEDQLQDIVMVLNHEYTLAEFLRDYKIKKCESGYEWR